MTPRQMSESRFRESSNRLERDEHKTVLWACAACAVVLLVMGLAGWLPGGGA